MASRDDVISPYAHRTQDIKDAAERYLFLERFLAERHDDELLRELRSIREICIRYINAIVAHKHKLERIAYDEENKPLDLQRAIELADQSRKATHDALIDCIIIFNRTISKKYGWQSQGGKIPVGGVYTLDPRCLSHTKDCRSVVGDWAVCLIIGLELR